MSASYHCDLHIHSCLSPCGDTDMTPNNIAGMAKLKGLDVIALTDHNTSGNCEAAMKAGERMGVLVLPGMELCTSEDIHVVCLFASLTGALGFSKMVYDRLPAIPNRPDIFGEQTLLDAQDNPAGIEEKFLLNAAGIGVNHVQELAERYGGVAFPAHIDRAANGILGVLGAIPPEAAFTAAEISPACDREAFLTAHPETGVHRLLRDSDAHYLWQISERGEAACMDLEELTRASVIAFIKRGNY